MRVLMVGVSRRTGGGMWSVVQSYLDNKDFCRRCHLHYIAVSTSGNIVWKLIFNAFGLTRVFFYNLFYTYDILHIHMSERGSVFRKYYVMKICRLRRPKIIIHMHGAEFEKWYKSLNKVQQNKVRQILNTADVVILLGEYWRNFVSHLLDDDEKIRVLYNSVEKREYCYDSTSKKIIFLGEVSKRKGIYDLLESIKHVLPKDGFKLFIYGKDKVGGVDALIKRMGLENLVIYGGYLREKEKKRCFKDVALSVLPSYNEGLPVTILETMSFGIPNISTMVAAIPEVIVNNQNGMLVKPGDVRSLACAIDYMITNPEERVKMSKKAYNTVMDKFLMGHYLELLFDIYKELLAR